jgi:hypothetical protein
VGPFTELDEPGPTVTLPMERPLYNPPVKVALSNVVLQAGDTNLDAGALFGHVRVDKAVLAGHVRQLLQTRKQISLAEVVAQRPLNQGLSELVVYLQLASESTHSVVDDTVLEDVQWQALDSAQEPVTRHARLPRVLFVRG